jgi:SYP7 family syntaxin
MNAELRKEKTLLLDEIPALEQLLRASPSKKKPVTQEIEYERRERLAEVIKAVEDVPDGLPGGPSMKPQRLESATNGSASYSGRVVLDINNLSPAVNDPKAYEHTQDTAEFVRDATMAKERQDLALDNIERGISTLKELGAAMGDELERHDVVIDEVGAKMDTVTKELQNNNMKLKGLVTQVRSSRRFFIDLILICVLLGLGLYIFNMVSK